MIQVRVVATLLILQGLLESVFGLLLLYQWNKTPVAVAWITAVFALSALKVVAGVVNWRYHKRQLGLVALGTAPLSVFALFCLPTAMILMVYGLIVYLNGDTKRAFA